MDDCIVRTRLVGFSGCLFGSGDGGEVADDYAFCLRYSFTGLFCTIFIASMKEYFVACPSLAYNQHMSETDVIIL